MKKFDIVEKPLLFYYLLVPSFTIFNFTVLKGSNSIIVYFIILFPLFLFLIAFPLMGSYKFAIPPIWKFVLFAFWSVVIVNYFRSINNFFESSSSLIRFFSSSMLFFIGYSFYRYFIDFKTQKRLIYYGISGGILGILSFFIVKKIGFTMTHSITADGMIAPLIYLISKYNGIVIVLVSTVLILFSGKSANLVAYSISLFSLFNRRVFKNAFMLLLISSLLVLIYFFQSHKLPAKLVARIDMTKSLVLKEKSFEDIGNKLTSGRSSEISYIINSWITDPIYFFIGKGLFTEAEKSDESGLNSTVHMSYLKVMDMIGLFGFILFLCIILCSLYLAIKSINVVYISLFGFYIIVQLILSIFQYSLLQDPILWISFGILVRYNQKKC